MNKTELKTYLQVLKSKVKTSPYKEVEITGTQIKVRGEKNNRDILFVLNCGTKGNGIYSPEALDMLLLDIEANIEAYRKGDAEGWQVAEYTTNNDLYVDKEVMARLDEASKYVSKDTFRPSLCRVHFKNGDIMATDGYRAYLDKVVSENLNGNLAPSTITIIKKCFKYGDWHIAFGTTPWSDNTLQAFNGYFTIWDKGTETSQTPEMRTLLEERDLDTNVVIKIPYTQIKSIDSKGGVLELDIDDLYKGEGEKMLTLTLGGLSLPLRATATPVSATYTKGATLRVLMPRVDRNHYLSISATLLKGFPTDKEGNVYLQMNEATKEILLVV